MSSILLVLTGLRITSVDLSTWGGALERSGLGGERSGAVGVGHFQNVTDSRTEHLWLEMGLPLTHFQQAH